MTPVALITGGARGIGAATARRFAAEGWSVVIGYRSDHAAAAEVVASCRNAIAVAGDLADPSSVGPLFDAADQLGPLGALVNNAGIVAPRQRVDEMPVERIQRMFAVNAVAPMLCAAEAVRRMSTAHGGDGGAIVNVSSIGARVGSPGQYVDYAASKGAIDTLTIGLAKEVAGEGIRVNGVRPGIVDTEIHASGGEPDRAAQLGPQIPMGRAGAPDEIANAIWWLCSDEASYVTAAILEVGGGR